MTDQQQEELLIVARAVVRLRHMQDRLREHCRHPRTIEFGQLMTTVRQMEAQVDAALETVCAQIMRDEVAADD